MKHSGNEHTEFSSLPTRPSLAVKAPSGAGVVLPRDLYAHPETTSGWWYYHGHLQSGDREFGFELAFFRYRLSDERIGNLIPFRWITPVVYFAHLSIADISSRQFHFLNHRALSSQAHASEERLEVYLNGWTLVESEGHHVCHVGNRRLHATLKMLPHKPAVLHGSDGKIDKHNDEDTYYFSYSRMKTEGKIRIGGESFSVAGSAWMDREFGSPTPGQEVGGWNWMGLQLDDGRELTFYCLHDEAGAKVVAEGGIHVTPDGSFAPLRSEDFEIEVLDRWTSPWTGNTYPCGWNIRIPKNEMEFEVLPIMKCQEIDTRGTTCIIFWEGAAKVRGKIGSKEVGGRAYVELSGYDPPGRKDVLDFRNRNLSLRGWLSCELRWWLGRRGKTLTEDRTR